MTLPLVRTLEAPRKMLSPVFHASNPGTCAECELTRYLRDPKTDGSLSCVGVPKARERHGERIGELLLILSYLLQGDVTSSGLQLYSRKE
jgi:hypothetical protein